MKATWGSLKIRKILFTIEKNFRIQINILGSKKASKKEVNLFAKTRDIKMLKCQIA